MTQPDADVVGRDSLNGASAAPLHTLAPDMDDPPPPPPLRLARRRLPIATLGLAMLVFAAAGFLVGVRVEKTKVPVTTAATAAARPAAAAAAANPSADGTGAPTAAPGGAVGAGVATTGAANIVGTVAVVDGTTLYVTDAAGNTVKVTTNTGTTVTKTVTGAVKDLTPGQTVVIRGVQSSQGVYAAQSVIQGLAGGVGGFGGGGRGARPSAAPTAAAGNG